MVASTPNEVAPPYEELHSRPSRSANGYTRVPDADEPDLERNTHLHHHDAPPPPPAIEMNDSRPKSSYSTEHPHTHCEECDRQLERWERRRSRDQCCEEVSRTMMIVALFLMICGIVAVLCAKAKRSS